MTTNFLRAYNNGEIYMPQSIEENEIINKDNILHYFNFADGCMFDRRYFFQIDYHKFNSRDGFPKYTSLNNIKFKEANGTSTGSMETLGFTNFKNTSFEITGKVKVTYIKQSDLNLVVKAGIMTGDRTFYEDWKGHIIGKTKDLQHEWHEFYGVFNTTTLNNTNFIAPWLSVVGSDDEISQNMYIEFKDVTILPTNMYMPNIEVKSKIRYITYNVQGWVFPGTVSYAKFCNVVEIKAFDKDGNNVALNKPVTTVPDKRLLNGGAESLKNLNDGDTVISNYICFDPFVSKEIKDNHYSFTIDLENEYDIERIEIYNYPGRIYSFSLKVGKNTDNMISIYNNEFDKDILRPLLINKETSSDTVPHKVNIKDMLFDNSTEGYLAAYPEKTYTHNLSDLNGARVLGDVKFLPYRNDMDFAINLPIVTDYMVEMNPTQTPDNNYIARLIFDYINLSDAYIREFNVEFSCWMFIEPGFDAPYSPIIKLEEYPEYFASSRAYDITKLGTWQFLKTVYKGKVTSSNVSIESVTPIVQGTWNQPWTKGKIFVTGISINKIRKMETTTDTGFIKPEYSIISPNIIKANDFSMFIEFDYVNLTNTYKCIMSSLGGNSNFQILIYPDNNVEIRNGDNKFVTSTKAKQGRNKLAFSLKNNIMKVSLNGAIESKSFNWNINANNRFRLFNESMNTSLTDNNSPFNNNLCKLIVYDDVKTDAELINLTNQQKSFKLRENTFNQGIDELFLTKNIKNLLMNKAIIKYFPLNDDDKDLFSSTKLVSNYTKYNFNAGRAYIGEHSNNIYKHDILTTDIIEIPTNINLTDICMVFNYISTVDNATVDVWFGSKTDKQALTTIQLKNTGLSSETIIKCVKAQGQKIFIQIKNVEAIIRDMMITPGYFLVPGEASHTHNGLKINYRETMSVPMDSSFTICYKVRVIKRQFNSVVEAIKPTGRITLFQLGSCDATPKFIFLGKPGARDGYPVMFYSNMRTEHIKTYEGLTHDDWVTNEITVLVSYDATNNLFKFSLMFENGKRIEDTITLNSKIDTNSIKDNSYEFTIGSIRAIDQSMNFTISDLVMINGFMPLVDIKTLISPLSIGADGIRAGFQVNEKKKI